jgi:predicted phosphate transport protein (TIGR00153 family)
MCGPSHQRPRSCAFTKAHASFQSMGLVSKVLRPFMRRESEVFATILKYADEIALTASALRDLIGSLVGNRDSGVQQAYERLMELERRADFTRRKLSEEISRGGFFANIRELLLELVERMDKIADYSKDAGRLLYTSSSAGIDFSPLLKSEPLQRLLHCQSQCIDALTKALRKIVEGRKITVEDVQEVEGWEEEADEQKDEAIRQLFEHKASMDPADFVLMREFVLLLDDVCDAAEDSSDVLLNLIAVTYG